MFFINFFSRNSHDDVPAALAPEVKGMVSTVGVLKGLAWILPLWMLRRLGRAFNMDDALSLRTSGALRHLAHAIFLGSLLLPFLVGFIVEAADGLGCVAGGGSLLAGLRNAFIPLVACLCLYSLSWLIRLGPEAANDARGIV